MTAESYEVVIGLEVHVQLKTRTKLFCDCEYEFGAAPNERTCPVCSGHPGVLPVPNRAALRLGVRAGLALGCEIRELSKFDRKHYFYPDLPKGYQISQYDMPFAAGGRVLLDDGRQIGLERIHWEEDAGKSTHLASYSVVDLNRCGVPLIEIVGRPDLRSPSDAHAYLESLKRTMRYAGVSDCDMEKGSLRCDVNVSLRPHGQRELGTKVEIKNVNSFKMVVRALEFEIARQGRALDAGERVIQETRLWDDAKGETRSMRTKEEAMDYRYFPEPDIPPIRLQQSEIEDIRRSLPELHPERKKRYLEAGLSDYDAQVLTAERDVADYFEATWQALGDPKAAANWTQTDVMRAQNDLGVSLDDFPLRPATLAALIRLVTDGTVSQSSARKVFNRLLQTEETPEQAVDALGLGQISDPAELEPIVRAVVARSEKAVADYKKGKTKALDSLKGMVMRETRGRANPRVVGQLLQQVLATDGDG